MTNSSENSVTMALADIFAIEDNRVQAEAEKRQFEQKAQKEADERVKAEAAARDAALRAERERLEHEMATRDRDTASRIAALKAELNAVQWSREAIRSEIHAMATRRMTRPSTKSTHWLLAVVAVSACGVGLALGLASGREQSSPPASPNTVSASLVKETVSPMPSTVDPMTMPETTEPSLSADAAAPSSTVPAKTAKHPLKNRKTKQKQKHTPTKNPHREKNKNKNKNKNKHDLSFFDDCGMDPMCGFDKKKR